MKRAELEHIIRASSAIADDPEIVIIGSQALLGQFPDAPPELLVSLEADVFPKNHPAHSIVIDGAIGELSTFHQTHGYYAHGVAPETAVLPQGWQSRLIPIRNENTRGATGLCLEVHDLAVSKLVAGREKDCEFVRGLFKHNLADAKVVRDRLNALSLDATRLAELEQRLIRLSSQI